MNVLLVILDSVRAQNCSLYGHGNETTPNLEKFAEEATTYTQARAPGTWSLPSHTSIFTGHHVEEHKIRKAHHRLEGETIWDELPHRTGVFSENMWITDMGVGLEDPFNDVYGQQNMLFQNAIDPGNFALAEGQGQYVKYLRECLRSDSPLKGIANGLYNKIAWDYPQLLPDGHVTGTPAEVYTDLFLDWSDDHDEWAACVNFMDAHLPYEPDPEFDLWDDGTAREIQDGCEDQVWEFNGGGRPWWQMKALEALYDGAIRKIDHELGRIRDELISRGEWDDTLVVVTSDHGEGFGEYSEVRPDARITGHGAGIHEAQLHVPLQMKEPGQSEGGAVNEVVSLTEFPHVVHSVLDGNDGPRWTTPGPVFASSHGLEEPMEERAQKFVDDLHLYNGDYRAVYTQDGTDVVKKVSWRDNTARVLCHRAGVTEVFDESVTVDHFYDEVMSEAGIRGTEEDNEVSDQVEQRLEDLGYA